MQHSENISKENPLVRSISKKIHFSLVRMQYSENYQEERTQAPIRCEVPHLRNSLWGWPTPNKTLICTCIVSRFEANGIMLYFNNVELGLLASPKGLPVLAVTQKTGGTSAFFAPDSLHVRVSPPVWKVPYSRDSGGMQGRDDSSNNTNSSLPSALILSWAQQFLAVTCEVTTDGMHKPRT